jgi:hypothetical protein
MRLEQNAQKKKNSQFAALKVYFAKGSARRAPQSVNESPVAASAFPFLFY